MFRLVVRSFSALALLVALSVPSAQANQITEIFPTDQSIYQSFLTSGTGLGGTFAVNGSYIYQTYSSTGLAHATGADWTINFNNSASASVTLDLFVNNTVVDHNVVLGANVNTLTVNGLSFSAVSGPDYTLEVQLTSTIPSGQGSFQFTGGSVTLNDGVAAAVPEPSTLATGLIGVAGAVFAAVRRRRVANKA